MSIGDPLNNSTLLRSEPPATWQSHEQYATSVGDPVCLALFGEIDLLKECCFDNEPEVLLQEIVLAATFMGHLHIVQWIYACHFEWPDKTTLYATKYRYPEILSFVLEKGAPIHDECLKEATKNNDYECVSILLGHLPQKNIKQDMLLPIWDDLSAEIQDKLILLCLY